MYKLQYKYGNSEFYTNTQNGTVDWIRILRPNVALFGMNFALFAPLL